VRIAAQEERKRGDTTAASISALALSRTEAVGHEGNRRIVRERVTSWSSDLREREGRWSGAQGSFREPAFLPARQGNTSLAIRPETREGKGGEITSLAREGDFDARY